MARTLTVIVLENGPYLLPGPGQFAPEGAESQATKGKQIALCRCGHSANKPFCDGTHKHIGFQAPGGTLTVPLPEGDA